MQVDSPSDLQLLPFQHHICETIVDPASSDLLILAKGLGLRKILCSLLKIYDGPQNLVLLVNATDEEDAIGEELGVMGCRKPGLRVVGFEMGRKERQILYKQGGLISVTSRILVVDMLQSDIPVEKITGLIVLHGEKVTSISLEAFVIRLYRENNKEGFVKAFSDAPDHFTSGLYPLKTIMKELQLRKVHIYPRFHEKVKESLEHRRADIVELHQDFTEKMSDIHQAIVQCMTDTLAELKKANTTLELDDLTVENAYFRSFDAVVRKQLDPIWHKVGLKTKQLVSDLATLRNLLFYLISYDSLSFHAYLETVIASNSTTQSGVAKQNQSHWLYTDAANVIFQSAKRRCYVTIPKAKPTPKATEPVAPEDDIFNDPGWDVLNENEVEKEGNEAGPSRNLQKKPNRRKRRRWLPDDMDPVLEELPKWSLMAEVLEEIEEQTVAFEATASRSPGTNTVLIMCNSPRSCELLGDYLNLMNKRKKKSEWGRRMMERRLRLYLWWKAKLNSNRKEGRDSFHMPSKSKFPTPEAGPPESSLDPSQISDKLKKKDEMRKERIMNRRRVRGGAPANGKTNNSRNQTSVIKDPQDPTETLSAKEREKLGILSGEGDMRVEAENIAQFLSTQQDIIDLVDSDLDDDNDGVIDLSQNDGLDVPSGMLDAEFDFEYGLLAPEQTVLIKAYSDDADDKLLEEVSPRFIVMYEPNPEFVRRIECHRSSNPGLSVRVYLMLYRNSCEEHKLLAGIRREKECFVRLIKERSTMVLTLGEDRRVTSGESIIKTISSRIAGGKQLSTAPSQVIVDMREFRSTLPSLLHASRLLIIPATLTVGDYILTPDICVERKSIPDLIQSFTSGRLYTQCELMSAHYKQPVLLIEFEEHKSFSLEIVSEMKSYVKPTGKYPPKKQPEVQKDDTISITSVQSKLVLLTLNFPRLRIVWSSSPYATADIFNDLKANHSEPDASRAVAVGAEEDTEMGAGVNQAAEELLRSLPGITAKNVKYVMGRVGSIREFCALDLPMMQDVLGSEPGKMCYNFIHQGD